MRCADCLVIVYQIIDSMSYAKVKIDNNQINPTIQFASSRSLVTIGLIRLLCEPDFIHLSNHPMEIKQEFVSMYVWLSRDEHHRSVHSVIFS